MPPGFKFPAVKPHKYLLVEQPVIPETAHGSKTKESDNNHKKFWIYDPSVIFQTLEIVPSDDMNNDEKFNAMTRIIIVITIILYLMKFSFWWLFLVLSLIVIIVLFFIFKNNEKNVKQIEFLRPPRKSIITPINKSNINIVPKSRR